MPGDETQGLIIPSELRAKHGDLIDLVVGSESMNDEERQYWINILPIMTPDQLKNLRDILENERKQLKAIDEKYAKEIEQIGQQQIVRQTDQVRRERRTARREKEHDAAAKEEPRAEDLLKQIEAS